MNAPKTRSSITLSYESKPISYFAQMNMSKRMHFQNGIELAEVIFGRLVFVVEVVVVVFARKWPTKSMKIKSCSRNMQRRLFYPLALSPFSLCPLLFCTTSTEQGGPLSA